ncbi:HD-GYP domain-containing protein [Devosia sp.]|uniref:HD-GYP domain-containing protein n=1 Tax=Devosia sp. TaxID=1871048 RepID=UPI003BADAA81
MTEPKASKDVAAQRELAIACDAEFQRGAEVIARELSIPLLKLSELTKGSLAARSEVVVKANLRNIASVEALRNAFGGVRGQQKRYFVVEDGGDLRLWRIQADALGASHHIPRKNALYHLRRMVSLGGATQLTDKQEAALRAAKGGESILNAGRSLARLFDGMMADRPISMAGVSTASADVLRSVKGVGAEQWLTTVRHHHEGTFQHCLLVTGIAASYARHVNLKEAAAVTLTNAAMLHDIGKSTVPLHVLDKPGKLTNEEFELVKKHPAAGYDYLLKQRDTPAAVLDAVRHHHEALDGSGYPDGLRASEITALTRILTVCDIMAALVEHRSYKEDKTPAQAISILVDMAIRSKVDYDVVRNMAGCFSTTLPKTLEEVVAGVSGGRASAA